MKKILTNNMLGRDAELAPDIRIGPDINKEILEQGKNILLTGATGFLGVFLLHSLLKNTEANIYCLVRPKENQTCEERIKNCLEQYRLDEDVDYSRIIAIEGDLEQKRFGLLDNNYETLCKVIDTVYHNGALVNYAFPYSALKKANVTATEEILRFCVQKNLKKIHYISTMFVFSGKDYIGQSMIREDDPPIHGVEIGMGYGQSKWVAERMIRLACKEGIPADIIRVARISGDTVNGMCQVKDFLWSYIRTCFSAGCRPEIDAHVNISPVNFVSDAIVSITKKNSSNKIFHVLNPDTISFEDLHNMIEELGYSIKKVSYEEWKLQVMKVAEQSGDISHELLVRMLEQINLSNTKREYDMSNTLNFLENTEVSCPKISKELVEMYINYFINIGFIQIPQMTL